MQLAGEDATCAISGSADEVDISNVIGQVTGFVADAKASFGARLERPRAAKKVYRMLLPWYFCRGHELVRNAVRLVDVVHFFFAR